MPQGEIQAIKDKIRRIQDIAIILTSGAKFVCEKRMLKKFSGELESTLADLENTITALKNNPFEKEKRRLGTFFSEIRDISKRLASNDADLEEKCISGDIGGKLKNIVLKVKGIINNKQLSPRINDLHYTISDRAVQNSMAIKSFFLNLMPFFYTLLKILLTAGVFAVGLFAFLFFTMESKNDLIDGIKIDRVYVDGKKTELEAHRSKQREIIEKIKSIKNDTSTRKNIIEVFDLTVKKEKIQESIEKTLLSIESREKNISEKERKLRKINEKSFLQRLLRK